MEPFVHSGSLIPQAAQPPLAGAGPVGQVRAEAESGAVATEEIALGAGPAELLLPLQHTTAQVADTKTTNERTEP